MTNESIETAGGKLEFHRRRPVAGQSAGTVILLHPWFGCWQFWNRTIDALPEFDTISVDLYSLGDRTDWREFAGPDGLATAVGGLLDASHIAFGHRHRLPLLCPHSTSPAEVHG